MKVVEAHELNKKFHQGGRNIEILKSLELSVEEGEKLSIIGPSGSGKTTLLSVLAGLDPIDSGKIVLNGTDISKYNEKQLCDFRAKNVGIVFQQYHLMPHLNAVENVMLPLEINGLPEAREKAVAILTDFGLGDRIEHMPHQLSGGESQRVAIARSMVHQPKVIFADEPSGNLDEATGDRVMSLLFEQITKNKMTLVLVTHNNELAKSCDRQLTLHNGVLK